jgi:AcrR family transcriptional regulator
LSSARIQSSGAAHLTARGQAARQRIVAAAAEILAHTGELEVAQVAARAGVSTGLPYRYFGDRSGLISAVIEDFHARLSAAVAYARFAGATWQEREQRRVAAWVQFLYRDPLSPVLLGGLGGDAAVAASWQRALSRAIELGARNIAAAQRAGDLPSSKDARLLAAAVLGGVQSAVAAALAASPRPSERRVADALWTFVRGAAEAVPSRHTRGV